MHISYEKLRAKNFCYEIKNFDKIFLNVTYGMEKGLLFLFGVSLLNGSIVEWWNDLFKCIKPCQYGIWQNIMIGELSKIDRTGSRTCRDLYEKNNQNFWKSEIQKEPRYIQNPEASRDLRYTDFKFY